MAFDQKKYFSFIVIIFLLKIFILGIYSFHHPSEARYASIAMRMDLTGNYLMPYFDPSTPFLGKPPLSFWASAISFKLFGFNEFAGRLPHLLAILAVCFLLYRCVEKTLDKKTAINSVLVLSSCFLFYSLHSVMTEAFLLLGLSMITLSFWLQIESEKPKNIYGYLFFLGSVVSMLTKGPVGIAMAGLPIFIYLFISKRWQELFQKFPIFSGIIIFLALTLPWFILVEMKYPGFLKYFFVGENLYRFTQPGWKGDQYGNAHKVPFGMIWYFFIAATLPVIPPLFAKPKQVTSMFLEKIKNDKNQLFIFFSISLIVPLIILTFMRNMIATYAIYSLVPFAVIMSAIITEKRWYKFISFLAYFTISLHALLIIGFLVNPLKLAEHLNYQAYLSKQIPKDVLKKGNFQLYYMGKKDGVFSLNWYSKDKLKFLDENNFSTEINSDGSNKYVIADVDKYHALTQKDKDKLDKITCTKKRQACLFQMK